MPKDSRGYDPSVHEALENVDWDAVFPEVLKYAVSRCRLFIWLGYKADPEALVKEAIARVYGIGTNDTYRNWNREKCSDIAVLLKGVIRSMTSHAAEHASAFPNESLFNADGIPKDYKFFDSADESAGAKLPKTPEAELIELENLKALTDVLLSLRDNDEDLGMVILCFEDGISEPRHIAHKTGFPVSKVYNILKRLRRKLQRFKPQIRKQSSKERREEWA